MVFHRIKDLREDNDYTQQQIADYLHLNRKCLLALRNRTARNPRLGGNQIVKILSCDNGLPVGHFRFERVRRMALNGAKMNIA